MRFRHIESRSRHHISSSSAARPLLRRQAMLKDYRLEWFRHDLAAGLSVAAVAIPVALAYAALAGFPPVVGLYAAMLPLVVYAFLGTSKLLIVNPDSAVCAMVAAIVAPLAAGDAELYASLSMSLAVLTGLGCILAGFFRLGFLADFLGKPILVGFMNGIAISIVLGQIGKIFGFPIESGRILPRLFEFLTKLPSTHFPTLAVGAMTVAAMIGVKRLFPKLPAPLIAVGAAVVLVQTLSLDQVGVAVVGTVPSGLPALGWRPVPPELLLPLASGALGLALVSITSGILTARSFAERNHYEISVNREIIAFGGCNVAAGLSQGFAVTAADSRTAMNETAGGRTKVAGLVAAAAIALVLVFFTGPLRYLPQSALGAVLIVAASGLFDWRALVRFARIREGEFLVCVAAMLGVVILGALEGIGLAVGLAILVLLVRSSRPADAVLGRIEGVPGFHDLAGDERAATIRGLTLYRFTASVIFYNARYFKQRALAAALADREVKWLVIDGASIVHLDSTGADTIVELADELKARDIKLVIGGVLPQVRLMLERSGAIERIGRDALFHTVRSAVEAYSTVA